MNKVSLKDSGHFKYVAQPLPQLRWSEECARSDWSKIESYLAIIASRKVIMSKLPSRVLSMEVTYVIERKYTPKKRKKY